MTHSLRRLSPLGLCLTALVLTGCGPSASAPSTAAAPAPAGAEAKTATAAPAEFPGMEADLQRTLKEQASFYHFKTMADFAADTKGLVWDDGSDLPPFADPAAKRGGTLHLWLDDFPGTFRPIGPNSNSAFRNYLIDEVGMNFVRAHPNVPGRFYPQLATSWAVDAAHKTVYFKLDPNARWSDGVPLTTDDVVFSWYFYRSPELQEPWYNDFYTKTYGGLTVYDAHTFSLTLSELRPDIVSRAGEVEPFPKHFYHDFGPGWVQKYNWRVVPTAGPYTIKEEDIKRTTSITLSRVKDWWGDSNRFMRGRWNPDRVHLAVIRDPDKAFEAFLRGDLDIFGLSTPLWYDKLPNTHPSVTSGFTVKAMFYNQVPRPDIGLWINEAIAPLNDLNIRLGIQYSSNMALVCKQYFRGDAVVQKTASDGYGWDPNPEVVARPFDPAKAREYFAKAGYTQQGPDGVLTNASGKRLSFTITTIYRRYQDVLVILKQEALKAGLELNIEVLDSTTGWQKTQEKKHQITLVGFSRPVEMYPRYWESFSGVNAYDVPYLPDGSPNPNRKVKTNTNNLSSIAISELDKLITAYDKTETMDQVRALSSKMEKILYDNADWVNGWAAPFYRVGYRPWIKWPKDFNAMKSLDFEEQWLFWIDPDEQKETLAAKAEGRALPAQVLIYDRFKEK